MTNPDELVSVRYLVDDMQAAAGFSVAGLFEPAR